MNRVEITLLDTSSLPFISAKESDELLLLIASGDTEAREKFIRANMRLVLSMVGRFSRSSEDADDLFQVGMVGLLKALDNFDCTLGVRFSTYAVPMIMGEIKRFLRDHNSIKVSRSVRDTAYRALKAKERLTDSLSREPAIAEIAAEIDATVSSVACALDAVSTPISFFEPVYSDEDEGMTVFDRIADQKETEENWAEKISLYEALKNIPSRELAVLKLRYFEGKTQTEISSVVGISQAQVSRLEKNAIDKLRTALG